MSSKERPDSWEKLPGEPPRAHALFEGFLLPGPGRTLPPVARAQGVSLSYVKKLSVRWDWRERAESWQSKLYSSSQTENAETIIEARERQLKQAVAFQRIARAELARSFQRDPDGTRNALKRFSPYAIARLWQTGFRLESELRPPPSVEPIPDLREALLDKSAEEKRAVEDTTPLSEADYVPPIV